MIQICSIDNEIYSCIAGDLTTNEVIITDEQIEHSNKRHQNAYDKYKAFIPEVLAQPDEILRDKRPFTGLIVKEIKGEEPNSLLVVLRIRVSQDPEHYKNSIINCWKIDLKRYKNYRKSREILYKAKGR